MTDIAPLVRSQPPGLAVAAQEATPLSPEHVLAIAVAKTAARKITRAVSVAGISGGTCAVFACFTMLGGIFDLTALLLGFGLMYIAIIELRSGKKLRQFDLNAPAKLGYNQIALGIMLIAYATWAIIEVLIGPGVYDEYLQAGDEMSSMIEPIAQLHTFITIAVYGSIIPISLICQGGLALYYFTRRRHIQAYLKSTPAWVVHTLRAAA